MTESSAEQQRRPKKDRLLFGAQTAAILAIAVWLRTYDIEVRPPHSDEAVNYLFIETTNRTGYFPYSHENYHGPLYFYLITWFVNTFGDGLLALRGAAIASGVLTIASILLYTPFVGRRIAMLGALFVTLSPSLIFFSRYGIHESTLLLGENILALASLWWWKRKDSRAWYAVALGLAILITTKESFPITVASIGVALLSLRNVPEHWRAVIDQRTSICRALVLMIALVIFVFTAGFRWTDGAVEMFKAIPQWIGRGHSETGHFKPVLYYLQNVIWQTEPQLILAFALAALISAAVMLIAAVRDEPSAELFPENSATLRFFGVWTVVTTAAYSIIKYKTVWLVINITFPAALFAAALLGALTLHQSRHLRLGAWVGIGLVIVSSWVFTMKYNYRTSPVPPHALLSESYPYGQKNPFSYVHTDPGMLKLVADVREYWKKKPEAQVLIGVEGYFPLPYFFRNESKLCAYMPPESIDKAAEQYDVMILDAYKHKWSSPLFEQRYYRLSDYNESLTYFKKLPQ